MSDKKINTGKYCLVYKGKVIKDIVLLSEAAKAPRRGGGWVADKKLATRAKESESNPNLKLKTVRVDGYEMGIEIAIPEGSEITKGGQINGELMKSHVLVALNKLGEPMDFGIEDINGNGKQPQPQKKFTQNTEVISIATESGLLKFYTDVLAWGDFLPLVKVGKKWDGSTKTWLGYTKESAMATAKEIGVGLADKEGNVLVRETLKSGQKSTPNIKPVCIRKKNMTSQDLTVLDNSISTLSELKWYGMERETAEHILLELLKIDTVPGKLDEIKDGGEIRIYNTGNGNRDFGSLSESEAMSILWEAIRYGVNPLNSMSFWCQLAKSGTTKTKILTVLDYDKYILFSRLYHKHMYGGTFEIKDEPMTEAECKVHRVKQGEVGYKVRIIWDNKTLGTGYASGAPDHSVRGRTPIFKIIKQATVMALIMAYAKPDADMFRRLMRQHEGEKTELERYAEEVERKKVAALPEPKPDGFELFEAEQEKKEFQEATGRVTPKNYDDIGGDYYEAGA